MPLNNYRNLISFIDFNHDIVRRRHQRNMNRRIRCRIINRTYRRHISTNNANTFSNLITQLPLQITNDPFTNQLFNGEFNEKDSKL
ncbi:hypothetical protein RhiirC2_797282 [Rhizophagus irregularis]|uniref:Uncharacterized protein n=1 Tax=Rhizophagus irregularis TaxID=588596 RepID=A0A2N1M8A1_9GLOM|nr:hypothetical protein RhiirC2_797282 [Rhizophagus irregularis]